MNKRQLIERISGNIGEKDIKEIVHQIQQSDDDAGISALYALVFHTDLRLSTHAAWILTHLDARNRQWLYPKQDELIRESMQTSHTGKRRLLLTLLLQQPFHKEEINGQFLEFCFKHMLSVRESIAIKALCMKLAYAQCRLFPELLEELRIHLEIMEPDLLSPGLKVARKKILKNMEKENKRP